MRVLHFGSGQFLPLDGRTGLNTASSSQRLAVVNILHKVEFSIWWFYNIKENNNKKRITELTKDHGRVHTGNTVEKITKTNGYLKDYIYFFH